jgi:hydrogenase maturation protease
VTPGSGVLVLGIGNTLLGDEGVGVRVARALAEADDAAGSTLPPGTRIVDGGTLGLDLLPLLGDAQGVVVVDAVNLARPAGSVAVIRGEAARSVPQPPDSAHELGLATLLETARFAGQLPARVSIVGVQPGRIVADLELSPAVQAAVPVAAELARQEAWAMCPSSRHPPVVVLEPRRASGPDRAAATAAPIDGPPGVGDTAPRAEKPLQH